jgi:hypothetical protein
VLQDLVSWNAWFWQKQMLRGPFITTSFNGVIGICMCLQPESLADSPQRQSISGRVRIHILMQGRPGRHIQYDVFELTNNFGAGM